jgi:hypothetical protein
MANQILICKKDIDSPSNRNTKDGKLLKAVFLLNPSKAVVMYGKAEVTINENISANNTQSSTDSTENTQQSNTQQSNTPQSNTTPSGNSESNSSESYTYDNHYSILEAYNNLCFINNKMLFEADDATTDNTDTEATRNFVVGRTINVKVLLPDEGYTIWTLAVEQSAIGGVNKIVSALKSKNFKAAFNIAKEAMRRVDDRNFDALVPIKAETYITPTQNIAPFIGQCRWAFDAGTRDDNESGLNLNIAIAPINAKDGKPLERTIYKSVYNITGDISDGKLDFLFNTSRGSTQQQNSRYGNDDNNEDVDPSEAVSKYLNGKFKCIGDSSMYKNFLSIKKYIQDLLKKNVIEYVPNESMLPTRYESTLKSANSFVYF